MSVAALKAFRHAANVNRKRADFSREYLSARLTDLYWLQASDMRQAMSRTVEAHIAAGDLDTVHETVGTKRFKQSSTIAEGRVRALLSESPGTWWSLKAVAGAIEGSEFGAVRLASHRLVKHGHIERHYNEETHKTWIRWPEGGSHG